MESDSAVRAEIAALHEEMDAIHAVNSLYWKQGEAVTVEARAQYQRRLDRLEEIRTELTQLQSWLTCYSSGADFN
jgi:hypothetical protein